ncbi:MAG: hypothetical protein K2N78_06530 [Oscillospiraceae bacterium]|nr:hypothetical protein [Oscillospiraceae bacterium]
MRNELIWGPDAAAAFLFALCAVVTLAIGGALLSQELAFRRHCRKGSAVILDYRPRRESKGRFPWVRFFHEGQAVEALVSGSFPPESRPRPGSVIPIWYRSLPRGGYQVRSVPGGGLGPVLTILCIGGVFFALFLWRLKTVLP